MKVKNIQITTVLTTNSDIELYNENLATMNPLILSTKEKDLEKNQNCNCEIKYITIILKRIILSILILYSYNLIATRFNLVIPINLITIGSVGILGFPILFVFVLLKVLIF